MGISVGAIQDLELITIFQNASSTERQKQKAFEEIYSRHNKGILFMFTSAKIDFDDASDLLMITMEKVHKNLDSFDLNKGAFSTWAYKIAKNSMIDYFRARKVDEGKLFSIDSFVKYGNYSGDMVTNLKQISNDSPRTDHDVISKENEELVMNAIDSIESPRIRRILKYRIIEGMNFEEIARKENVSADSSTIRVTARRGVNILRDKLKTHR